MPDTVKTDVFICGAGPVGLLIAYQLARMGLSTYIIDRYNVTTASNFGRASTLYPRTLELLDQLDLLDEMNQIGVIARSSVSWKDGKRVTSRGWHSMFYELGETYFNYLLNIRQKFSMEVIRRRYEAMQGPVHTEWTLEAATLDENQEGEYPVRSTIREKDSGDIKVVDSKYIIGADGGHSKVRSVAGIDFEGADTTQKWVRIDGKLNTNMPDHDVGFAAIESKRHGNVLWVQLENGLHRIGFALTADMIEKYGDDMTIEQATAEAKESMKPFTLDIERVEWWTIYKISQKVAKNFISGRVILAGDACHTHSSGAAQGMNTGIHDAVNLCWKLGGLLKGWWTNEVLETYEPERRGAAQTLINLDADFSACISGQIPERFGASSASPDETLTRIFDDSVKFTTGLGIDFPSNVLNVEPLTGTISAGKRGPDCLLRAPGSQLPLRLFQLTKNTGVFSVIVFAGQPLVTSSVILALRETTLSTRLLSASYRMLTIISGNATNADTALGTKRFGDAYYDIDNSAHTKYGISINRGGIVVLRPDGIVGTATDLNDWETIEKYFSSFMIAKNT